MLEFKTTNQFDKDLKRNLKRGKEEDKIRDIMDMIINQIPLDSKYKDKVKK
jgi:mRNA-degrading endonuclease YafQ of YafQ-DinJ toxin-antitoxin module